MSTFRIKMRVRFDNNPVEVLHDGIALTYAEGTRIERNPHLAVSAIGSTIYTLRYMVPEGSYLHIMCDREHSKLFEQVYSMLYKDKTLVREGYCIVKLK